MRTGTYTDQEILNGIQYQDNRILLFVYRKNFSPVKYYIKKNNGSDKDAEDVFQDAMILIYNKVQEGNMALKCSVHTYLFSVVQILWLRQLDFQNKRKFEQFGSIRI